MLTPLLALLALSSASADSARAAAAESAHVVRIVRAFPTIEVRAPLQDLRSSQTVRTVATEDLRALPVDDLAAVLALLPGVVVQAGELHVRGGRAGETAQLLEGFSLDEPLRHRPMDVPLLALRGADLVTGVPEAQVASGLAGALDLHTVDPDRRPNGELRWEGDGGWGTRFDRLGARAGSPLGWLGIGAVAAVDATLDDTWLPALRSQGRRGVLGIPLGWRAENRLLGFLKLAPVDHPRRFSAQVLASREVHQPFDPQWSLDGWVSVPSDPRLSPAWSPSPLPGYVRYRAADHLAITDERRQAVLLAASTTGSRRHGTVSLGWARTRTVLSVGGGREASLVPRSPLYGKPGDADPFHVFWGEFPLYRESGSDVLSLRGDAEFAARSESWLKAGAGLTYEDVRMWELDGLAPGWLPGGGVPPGALRAFRAFAPGASSYLQGRWVANGMVANLGLRAEWWTPGPQADDQALPGSTRGIVSISPRFGVAYPVSTRDVFSVAYTRVDQPPARDFLYDNRAPLSKREPLGNPALQPSTLISYEAALKHVFDPTWTLQGSLFYRDLFGVVGARDFTTPSGPIDLRYTNEDVGHAAGIEWSLDHVFGPHARAGARYTWLQAWGYESRPEGDPYGALQAERAAPIDETPLSWDRRHSLALEGAWERPGAWSLAWTTAVGSPLPWTPKALRAPATDPSVANRARLGWSEATNVRMEWSPRRALGITIGFDARNLFDERGASAATVDGYPNPIINTTYDDYGAYRTITGQGGGAYWVQPSGGGAGYWVAVHDPRLGTPPRELRASLARRW